MVSSAWPGVARASANAAALTVKTARLSSILISIPPNDFDGRLDPDDSVAGSLAYRPPPAASEFLSRAPHALGGYRIGGGTAGRGAAMSVMLNASGRKRKPGRGINGTAQYRRRHHHQHHRTRRAVAEAGRYVPGLRCRGRQAPPRGARQGSVRSRL